MNQLELRHYSREEISKITNVDTKAQSFKRNVGNTLTNWGYDWQYEKKSFTIIKKPETAKEKLSEILMRGYDMDIRCEVYDFAVFTYCLLSNIDGFAAMPWKYRVAYLKEDWNIIIAESTLKKWCKKLINTHSIIKDKSCKTYWTSYKIDGVKYQEELVNGKDNPAWKAYWHKFFELQKNGDPQPGLTAYIELGYCVYSCATFAFSAFNDIGLLEELIQLIREIASEDATDIIIKCSTEMIEVPREDKKGE